MMYVALFSVTMLCVVTTVMLLSSNLTSSTHMMGAVNFLGYLLRSVLPTSLSQTPISGIQSQVTDSAQMMEGPVME
jgi:hypothetical protein